VSFFNYFNFRVITELVVSIRADIGSLYKISEAVANLDVLYALANYSLTTLRCVRPKFSKDATSITMGRHPVLDSMASISPVANNTVCSCSCSEVSCDTSLKF
jgi:DNA mismatch repair protein MSH4